MIISRKGEKGSYKYVDSKNKEIEDSEIEEYIKKLVIPPNYNDVKIFYQKQGQPKILYQGFDNKKRLQRIYSAAWKKKAVRKKFCELLNFAEQIQKISAAVKEQMMSEKLTKKKMIAMIMRIVMVCYFRIGNKRYQELYGSFGAMNVQKKHIKFKKDAGGTEYMFISFSGKKGVLNICDITDRQLIGEVKKLLTFRDDDEMVFQWLDHGVNIPVRAIEINFWLKEFDPVITSKDFRTYDANIFLIIFLRAQRDPMKLTHTQRKKIIVDAMKQISEKIHNTPAILKKNYTAGGIVDMYLNEPTRFKRYFTNDKTPRQAFIGYLRDYCKYYDTEKKEVTKEGGGAFKKKTNKKR
jgi:DNA topoisomerase-1